MSIRLPKGFSEIEVKPDLREGTRNVTLSKDGSVTFGKKLLEELKVKPYPPKGKKDDPPKGEKDGIGSNVKVVVNVKDKQLCFMFDQKGDPKEDKSLHRLTSTKLSGKISCMRYMKSCGIVEVHNLVLMRKKSITDDDPTVTGKNVIIQVT